MKFLFVLLSAALLGACATPGTHRPLAQRQILWKQHSHLLNSIQDWRLSGRVALSADGRGWQAGVSWSSSPTTQEIQLNGPFGGGVVILRQDASGVSMRDSRGNEYVDTDAERLLQQVTGWRLPVNGLAYWVRGQVIGALPYRAEYDDNGALARLQQQGWDIRYLKYGEYGRYSLPQRMLLTRAAETDEGVVLQLRLALNGWKVAP